MQALLNLESEINTIHLNYTKKLSFLIWKIDVEAQKIDELSLQTFEMIIAGFQVLNKIKKSCFF